MKTMPLLRSIAGGIRSLFQKQRARRELDEELRGFMDMAAEEGMKQGRSQKDALRAVRLERGSVEAAKEVVRSAGWESLLETFWQDLRYGLRQLRRSPGFTAAAIITLALGIGANAAIFSFVDALMLRPLPYPQPSRIVHLSWKFPTRVNPDLSEPEFKFWRDHSKSFTSLAGISGEQGMEIHAGTQTGWVKALWVTDGFFRTFGVQPILGRGFVRKETESGAPGAAVLTNSLWRDFFHSNPNIIGSQLELNRRAYTVIGVLPREFEFNDPPDYPEPPGLFVAQRFDQGLGDIGYNTEVIGRLKTGVSLAQANAAMPLLSDEFRGQAPPFLRVKGTMLVESYQSYEANTHRAVLLLLLAVVGLLLSVACANVASLLLARATARQQEISVRMALGAGHARLLTQFLTEGLLLGLAGAAAGLGLAEGVLHAAVSAIPWNLPVAAKICLDGRVLLFTLLVGVTVSVVFALAGYFQSTALNWSSPLKEGRRTGAIGRRSGKILKLVVVGEVAMSLMLTLAAGLLLDSLYRLYNQNLGFDPTHLVVIETEPLPGQRPSTAALPELQREALARLRSLPGVESAALVSVAPLAGQTNFPVQRDGHLEDSIGDTEYRVVTPGYFSTMGIRLLRGRDFLASDTKSAQPVAVINETLARDWWPNGSPLGDRVDVGESHGHDYFNPPFILEVVGVVGDTRKTISGPSPAMVYVPAAQNVAQFGGGMDWVLRVHAASGIQVPIRNALSQTWPSSRVVSIRSMPQLISAAVAPPRFNALLLGMFGGLALLLTLVGIYGVLGFQLRQRIHEIGVRVALGATPGDIVRMVVGQAASLAALGIILGSVGAIATGSLLSNLLFEVKPLDPAMYVVSGALLMLVALAACYIPARRAMKVDPIVALRYE